MFVSLLVQQQHMEPYFNGARGAYGHSRAVSCHKQFSTSLAWLQQGTPAVLFRATSDAVNQEPDSRDEYLTSASCVCAWSQLLQHTFVLLLHPMLASLHRRTLHSHKRALSAMRVRAGLAISGCPRQGACSQELLFIKDSYVPLLG